jgi:hypothetical protein
MSFHRLLLWVFIDYYYEFSSRSSDPWIHGYLQHIR